MSTHHTLIAAMLMVASASVAHAQSASLNPFPPKVLPVLVQVNNQGKITDASPAISLTPQLDRLLRQNLGEIVTGPATRHGKPVSSQFVANMQLKAAPAEPGKYSTQFVYVSSSPVPTGRWHWVHIDGHRLALAESDSHTPRPLPHHSIYYRQPTSTTMPQLPAMPTVAPSTQPIATPTPRSGSPRH